MFVRQLYTPSSPNGTQPKPAINSEVSAIWKCVSKIWVSPSLKNWGPKITYFQRLCNLTATLTANVFATKRDIDNQGSALETRSGPLHCLKILWTLVNKRLKIGPEILLTLWKFCIILHCHGQTWNWTKLCQPVEAPTICHTNQNIRLSSRKK